MAQKYSFTEIREILLRERPRTGDPLLREECFGSIDDLIMGAYPPLNPDTKLFFRFMLEKAILEIQNEVVIKGATIWQIYNHGFVVKTPSVTFGFDLCHYPSFRSLQEFLQLAELLDVYFFSHEHVDHYSKKLMDAMQALGKPVVGPAEVSWAPIKMSAGESGTFAGLTVIAHDGLHSVPLRQFEVITPEGLRFLHTGDNQTSETLPPLSDVDVMMLNSWINESGAVSWIEGVRIAINKIKPIVTLPGHIMELGHLGGAHPPVPYRDALASDNGALASQYDVLAWGERYHYGEDSDDQVLPNIVDHLGYTSLADSIEVSWAAPATAEDGDTASFYRVIINDKDDYFVPDRYFHFAADETKKYNVKVYSYDDCGNQSETCAEIEINPNSSFDNGAVHIRDSGDYVLIPHADVLSPKQLTLECWIYVDGETGEQTIIDKRDESGGYNLRLYGSCPLGLAMVAKETQENILAVPGVVDCAAWHHVAATFDANEIRLFLDGELLGEKNAAMDISKTRAPLMVGEFTGYPGDSFVFHGLIDELRIWDVARTREEIKATKDDFLSGEEPHLVGYWKFDENGGALVVDSSPHGNDGVLKGGAAIIPSTAPIGASRVEKIAIAAPRNSFLWQNCPNPFNATTTISYKLAQTCHVTLEIYNMVGEKIATLVNEEKSDGLHVYRWDGRDDDGKSVATGLYVCRLAAGSFIATGKMLLLR